MTLLVSSIHLESENVQSLYLELTCHALTALVRGRSSTLKELIDLIGNVLAIAPDSNVSLLLPFNQYHKLTSLFSSFLQSLYTL